MGYVFVLYSSRSDQEFAKRLVTDLRQRGIDARSAQGKLEPGWDWARQTKSMKDNADIQLYVLSRDTVNASHWVSSPSQRGDFLFVVNFPTGASRITLANTRRETDEKKSIINFSKGYDQAFDQLLNSIPKELHTNDPLSPEFPLSFGYVFISYAEEDTAFVVKLRDFLQERGYGYWDYQSSDRNYQVPLSHEIEDVIRNAAATVSILSPDWKFSIWAEKEYLFSEQIGKPVFLLRAREMEPTLVTAGVTYIDFVRDLSSGFTQLDKELRRKGLI